MAWSRVEEGWWSGFLSYGREGRNCSGPLHRWLVAYGHEVFWDQNLRSGIAAGEEWDERLYGRLRWAGVVVCVVTSISVNSMCCD